MAGQLRRLRSDARGSAPLREEKFLSGPERGYMGSSDSENRPGSEYLKMIHGIFDLGNDPYGWLVGNKWIINCGSRAVCEKIQADLGGTIDAR